MKMKRFFSLILAGALLLGILSACSPAPPPPPTGTAEPPQPGAAPTGSLVVAVAAEPPTTVPARHSQTAAIPLSFLTHERLVEQHYYTLEPIGQLAREWRALSDVLFEFTLHEGITFNNGDELTAYDVVSSFYWVRQYPASAMVHMSAQSIELVDRYTFRLYTGVPEASLMFDLTSHGNSIFPRNLTDAGHDFHADPVGSGAYTLAEWRSGDFLRFEAAANHWNAERAPRIQEINWRIIPEGSSRVIAYEVGEVDFILDVPLSDVPRLQADPNTYVFMQPSPVMNFWNLNHNAPQFQNRYARKAIFMAIDQEELVEGAYDGIGVPTRASLPMVFAGASYEGVVPFDPAGAKALLAEHNIDPASLAFEVLVRFEADRRASEIMQARLSDIGIPLTITMVESAFLVDATANGTFEAAHNNWNAAWIISYMRNQFFHTNGFVNRNQLRNPEISEIIAQGMATVDSDARAAIFEEASRMINEYVVWVPIKMQTTVRAFNSNLVVPEMSGMTTILNLHSAFWTE